MSLAEIAERVRYSAVVTLERYRHAKPKPPWPDRLKGALVPELRTADWRMLVLGSRAFSRRRFLPSVRSREVIGELFENRYSRELADARVKASAARAQEFTFFGRTFRYDGPIPWQSDPVTGRPWPARYHADVPVHGGDVGFGDVKYVWELSRQQYLIDLSKVYFLDNDAKSLDAVRSLVRSWIAGNPVGTGVNWACTLEPAFRSFSWLWAYFLTAPALDDDFHLEWLCSFYDHGRFIARHLELYSSPFNHLVGEAAALFMLGSCFPEFKEAKGWCSRARAVLEGRLGEQFYADGGSVEQSTFYHHATVGYYLLAGLTARATGNDLSPAVWQAIERGIDFSMALVQPNGLSPEIGGADDGKPIRMEHLPFWDFRPYQAIGAVLFNRSDFKAIAGRFHEDALWLLGPAGLQAFELLDAVVPAAPSRTLASSGYYLLRSDWSDKADYVCFDCGDQAAGMRTDSVPNSMHGHADCLSIVVWLGGCRVLVDSGFYAYNCGGAWEAHFRETAAHNTARIDGRDQALHLGKMAWSHSYRARLEDLGSDEHRGWVIGSHDGFAREPLGVTHRRAVWLRPGGYLLVYDEFEGRGEHELEVNFQFAPGEFDVVHLHGLTFQSTVEMMWTGSATWIPEWSKGGAGPDQGWIAPSLGVREPAPRLRLRSRHSGTRTTLLTVLARRGPGDPRVALWTSRDAPGAPTVMSVSGEGFVDWVAARDAADRASPESPALVSVWSARGGGTGAPECIGGARPSILAPDPDRLSRVPVPPVGTRR